MFQHGISVNVKRVYYLRKVENTQKKENIRGKELKSTALWYVTNLSIGFLRSLIEYNDQEFPCVHK